MALTIVLAGVSTGVVVPGTGPAFADCPAPSWIQAVVPKGRVDSRSPGSEVEVRFRDQVTHWGDVKPGTRAVFGYDSYNAGGQFLGGKSWVTQPAKDNGVIRYEDEYTTISNLAHPDAFEIRVSFFFTDECTNAPSTGSGGDGVGYWELNVVRDDGGDSGGGGGDPDPCTACPPLEY